MRPDEVVELEDGSEFFAVPRTCGVKKFGSTSPAVLVCVLRHQLAILGRCGKRPQYTTADCVLLAAASRLLPRER